MARNWIDYFGFTGDPFKLSPPRGSDEIAYLFVKTAAIEEDIDPIIDYIDTSAPNIYLLFGDRGSGKSTIMVYINYCLQKKRKKILPIYIYHQLMDELTIKDAKYGIGSFLIWQMVKELISGIKQRFQSVYNKEKKQIDYWVSLLKLSGLENVERLPLWQQTYNILLSLLTILKKNNIFSFIGIDNYDKLPKELALEFLKQNTAQPLFEELNSSNVTILFSLKSNWKEYIYSDDDFSYLGNHINVSRLNPHESIELLNRRINWKSKSNFDITILELIDEEVLKYLSIKSNGNPREILKNTRESLIFAFRKKEKKISKKIINDIVKREKESSERYYEIIENTPSNIAAFNRLTNLSESFEDISIFKTQLNKIREIFSKEFDLEKINELEELRRFGIVELIPKANQNSIVIRNEIQILLENLSKKPLSIDRFFDWVSRRGINTIQIPILDQSITLSKFRALIELDPLEKIKNYLQRAMNGYNKVFEIQTNEDYDPILMIETMWRVFHEIIIAFYAIENPDKNKEPSPSVISEWLGNHSSNIHFFYETLKINYNFRYKNVISKEKTDEIIFSFDKELFAVLEEVENLLNKMLEEDKIPVQYLRTLDPFENLLNKVLNNQPCTVHIFDYDLEPGDFSLIVWKNFKPKQSIYGACLAKSNELLDHFAPYVFRSRYRDYFPPHVKPFIVEHAYQFLRNKQYLKIRFFSTSEFSNVLFRIKSVNKPLRSLILRPLGENDYCGQEWEIDLSESIMKLNRYPSIRPLLLINNKDEIQIPETDSELKNQIINARRNLNIVFSRKHKNKILLQDESAIFNIKRDCQSEIEFNSCITALSSLIDLIDVKLLDRILTEKKGVFDKKIKIKGGSIDRLTIFLDELYPNYDPNIIKIFKNILILRSKKSPIHRDDPKFLNALEYFGLPSELPKDWDLLWKICIERYLFVLNSLSDLIRN